MLPAMLIPVLAAVLPSDGPVLTRDLTGSDPGTYEEWAAAEPPAGPLVVRELARVPGSRAGTDLVIVLEDGLADSLPAGLLEQWAADMAPWVGEVLLAEVSYSSPEELREWLASLLPEGLDGAVLVGDLPAAWVMMDNAFLRDSETFPADYFFMDLDGEWGDEWVGYPSQGNPGSDGKYDTWGPWQGLMPEIYCARMKTSNLTTGTEAGLIASYLERNHQWRTWGDPGAHQALCYVDDDWAVWGAEFQQAMQQLYPDVELVRDERETNGTDYEENRLTGAYCWISPFVHSGPTMHQWNPGPETTWDEVVGINPRTRFYNLFACSNCRFTTQRNMGSIYVFATDYGLASVGSTKSGSMLQFEYFYGPLGDDESLGQAYRQWWEHIVSGGFSPGEMSWHLGMVLIGDPTLRPLAESLGGPGAGQPPSWPGGLAVLGNPCGASAALLLPVSGTLSLYDMGGRLVLERGPLPGGEASLDLGSLPEGLYRAVLEGSDGSVTTAGIVRLD